MVVEGIGPDGSQAPHEGNVLFKKAIFCLVSCGFERLAYYTMCASTSIYFLKIWHMSSVQAQQMQAVFQSIIYLLPVVGALIADTWTGRYYISAVTLGLSVCGAAMLLAGTATTTEALALTGLLGVFAGSIAMIKPNLIVLGADQFNDNKPDQLAQRSQFFGGIYWVTNIGATIATFVFASIAVNGAPNISKGKDSFTFTFILGTCFEFLAFLAILVGGKCLFAPKPKGSPLVGFVKVTKAALTRAPTMNGWMNLVGTLGLLVVLIVSIGTFFADSNPFSYTMGVLILVLCVVCFVWGRSGDWVLHAKHAAPGKFTDLEIQGVADVYRLTPYLACAIPFWAVFNSMNTSFLAQGCQMRAKFFAPSSFQGFDSLIIVVLIPIFNNFIYPPMNTMFRGKFKPTLLRRIGAGLGVAGCAMLAGALIEYSRRSADLVMVECSDENKLHGGENYWLVCDQNSEHYAVDKNGLVPMQSQCFDYRDDGAVPSPVRDISMYYQVISYCLVGISEILLAISYYDFFYSQVPDFIRAVCQAIQFTTLALGTLVGGVITSICKQWLPNNLDNGHQEYLYFINMAFTWMIMLAFIFVSRSFEYKPGTSGVPEPDQELERVDQSVTSAAESESSTEKDESL